MPELPQYDLEPVGDLEELKCPMPTLTSVLDLYHDDLLTLVGGAKLDADSVHLETNSVEIQSMKGYFLTWQLLLKYLQYCSTQVCS